MNWHKNFLFPVEFAQAICRDEHIGGGSQYMIDCADVGMVLAINYGDSSTRHEYCYCETGVKHHVSPCFVQGIAKDRFDT